MNELVQLRPVVALTHLLDLVLSSAARDRQCRTI
eukprot:COSAG06_NODE_1799_length_8367_cov_3.030721_2_plen_34_part_00